MKEAEIIEQIQHHMDMWPDQPAQAIRLIKQVLASQPSAPTEAAKEQGEIDWKALYELTETQRKEWADACIKAREELQISTTLPASTALNDERAKAFAEWIAEERWEDNNMIYGKPAKWFQESDMRTPPRTTDQLYDIYLATLPTPPKK